jgi:hypothetical protein
VTIFAASGTSSAAPKKSSVRRGTGQPSKAVLSGGSGHDSFGPHQFLNLLDRLRQAREQSSWLRSFESPAGAASAKKAQHVGYEED